MGCAEMYSQWMEGVPWSKCHMSGSNRPSLGSWRGWPWDAECVMNRAFKKGLIGTNVEAVCEMGRAPVDLVPATHLSMFQLVWDKTNKKADVAKACQDAIAATQKLTSKKVSKD